MKMFIEATIKIDDDGKIEECPVALSVEDISSIAKVADYVSVKMVSGDHFVVVRPDYAALVKLLGCVK